MRIVSDRNGTCTMPILQHFSFGTEFSYEDFLARLRVCVKNFDEGIGDRHEDGRMVNLYGGHKFERLAYHSSYNQ